MGNVQKHNICNNVPSAQILDLKGNEINDFTMERVCKSVGK
jgi:hypothetical protein